jgi:hypothetical protein
MAARLIKLRRQSRATAVANADIFDTRLKEISSSTIQSHRLDKHSETLFNALSIVDNPVTERLLGPI